MIEKKKNIIIYYNYEDKYIDINLDEKERFIKYNSEMDITIVEILPEDKIKEKYFLIPDMCYKNYTDELIYIPQFPGGQDLSYSEGKIKKINNFE